jgi:hypothetical protein
MEFVNFSTDGVHLKAAEDVVMKTAIAGMDVFLTQI